MGLFNHYTRGGQVAMHNFRMFRQVILVTFWITLLTGAGTFALCCWKNTTPYQWYLYQENLEARYFSFGSPHTRLTTFHYPNGVKVKLRQSDLLHSQWFRYEIFRFEQVLKQNIRKGIYGAIGGAFLVILFFLGRGRQQKSKQILKGGTVVKAVRFNRLIRSQKSGLKLAGCHLIRNAEMEHMLITGSTGVGKTNCLHELLPQIRGRGDRAIVIDLRGNMVSRYYRPGQDILINPFDVRSENWHIWAECSRPYHFDAMAEVLFPADKFSSGDHEWWLKAGRAMFSVTAQKLRDEQCFSMKRLKDLLIALPPSQILGFFAGTDMASFAAKESHKVTASVRNVLTPIMRKISCLRDSPEAFSIRDWIHADSGDAWLFLTAGPDQKETLQPLIASWLGWAVQSLKTMPETPHPRLWFICDELPQLKYLPTLEDALAEIRGFGGCFVAGIQDFHQMQKLYGHDSTHTLLTLFNTKVVFRCPDRKTASYMAESMGEHETREKTEGVSFGANDMRDGVSLQEQKKIQSIIRPSDLMKLPKLQAYLQVPGNYPPAHLHFAHQKVKAQEPWFVPAPEEQFLPARSEEETWFAEKRKNELTTEDRDSRAFKGRESALRQSSSVEKESKIPLSFKLAGQITEDILEEDNIEGGKVIEEADKNDSNAQKSSSINAV